MQIKFQTQAISDPGSLFYTSQFLIFFHFTSMQSNDQEYSLSSYVFSRVQTLCVIYMICSFLSYLLSLWVFLLLLFSLGNWLMAGLYARLILLMFSWNLCIVGALLYFNHSAVFHWLPHGPDWVQNSQDALCKDLKTSLWKFHCLKSSSPWRQGFEFPKFCSNAEMKQNLIYSECVSMAIQVFDLIDNN